MSQSSKKWLNAQNTLAYLNLSDLPYYHAPSDNIYSWI